MEEAWSKGRRSALAAPLLILAVSAVLHFAWFGRPASVVLDEVHYGRFTLAYLRHEFIFDIHPPLGRLLLWATAWLANLDPSFSFATIGLAFPDSSYLVLRVLPSVAGTLLPVLVYAVAIELGMTRGTALIVGFLAAIDNALLVISRFALIDVFILTFGFAALWSYLRAANSNSWGWTIAAAFAAGCAASIKWTGLAFLGIICTLQLVRLLCDRSAASVAKIMILCVVPAAIYFGSFAAQFALLDRSGRDDAFMSPQYQATLAGNPNADDKDQDKPGIVGKFIELNAKMYGYAGQVIDHPYHSNWYTWPLMMRGVYFWSKEEPDGRQANIYLLGDPVIWWAAGYAMLFLLVNFPPKIPALATAAKLPPSSRAELIVIFGYLANMLPFIALPRGMFLYHYLPALVFAILAIGLLLDRVPDKRILGAALLATSVCGFIYFAPLTYGLPVSKPAMDRMFWFEGWR